MTMPQRVLSLPSMPMATPSFSKGPYRFINCEYRTELGLAMLALQPAAALAKGAAA